MTKKAMLYRAEAEAPARKVWDEAVAQARKVCVEAVAQAKKARDAGTN